MAVFMAGAITTLDFAARSAVVSASSAMPWAYLPMRFAVAGATTSKDVASARSTCSGDEPPSAKSSVMAGRPASVASVSGPTLPAGTYPDWSGTVIYNAGQRVLFGGVPYQAKWWNQGDSPAAASSDPDGSPWVALTQTQIDTIMSTLTTSTSTTTSPSN